MVAHNVTYEVFNLYPNLFVDDGELTDHVYEDDGEIYIERIPIYTLVTLKENKG